MYPWSGSAIKFTASYWRARSFMRRQNFSQPGSPIRACSMSAMEKAVIVDALRTPIGRYGGALKDVRADDLAALVVSEAVQRNQLDPASIEDVYFGGANQAGGDNRHVARMAVLLAGLPVEIPAATMNRLCGSGMQAAGAGNRGLETGDGVR